MIGKLFSPQDIEQIKSLNLTSKQVTHQMELFEMGTPYSTLVQPAKINDGIKSFSQKEKQRFVKKFDELHTLQKMVKFIPASGAATRMFKIPLYFLNHPEEITSWLKKDNINSLQEEYLFMKDFLPGLRKKQFAFYPDLQSVLRKKNLDLTELLNQGKIETILEYLLTPAGLNYANLPKALLKFHQYRHQSRTPLEEHLTEAASYLRDQNGIIRLHFTLSPEFRQRVQVHLDTILKKHEDSNLRYEITFSVQQFHANTIAVDKENQPFRDSQGRIVFRPGGHGALIENLDTLTEDIVFITNIDNIVPDHLKNEVVFNKKVLGGYMGTIQEKVFHYLNELSGDEPRNALLEETRSFCENQLMIHFPEQFQFWHLRKKRNHIFTQLNRPIRVCGMVKNQGEPGGGPFWIRDKKNQISLQIIETTQVKKIAEQKAILSAASHFNPVDLVCGIKNFRGEKFNLPDFIDPDSYFISEKSMEGKPLKALELPGLWNGAMAKWITLFVDVPVSTFNPVKTINDLLREQHQPEKQPANCNPDWI
ncbi:MAG: DUF4301 family protein [Candidatus Aminicenantes bacterium]|nr:DUF4301 family protein [Candidatus Aminicenantes bacterium]